MPLEPTLMMAGKGASPLEGSTIFALKSMDLPLASTCTDTLVLLTVPVTTSGVGFPPRIYFSACRRISCRRQRHSAFVATRLPSSFMNGSGNFGIEVSAPGSGNVPTVQSALWFSTVCEPAPALPVLAPPAGIEPPDPALGPAPPIPGEPAAAGAPALEAPPAATLAPAAPVRAPGAPAVPIGAAPAAGAPAVPE